MHKLPPLVESPMGLSEVMATGFFEFFVTANSFTLTGIDQTVSEADHALRGRRVKLRVPTGMEERP